MRILLMGNFSGGTSTRSSTLASRKIYSVDVDNFDELISRFSPHLSLQIGDQAGSQIELDFNELDDFHPDALFKRLNLFRNLRELRNKLLSQNTFPQAAALLQGEITTPDTDTYPTDNNETDENMFERLLGKKSVQADMQHTAGETGAEQLIRAIVQPHIVPSADPLQQMYVDSVDKAISTEMRHLLHNPEFQALEAVWRSLYRLVTSLETSEGLELYLLDVTKQELMVDIKEARNTLHESEIYQVLIDQSIETPGGKPWSAIACDFNFGLSEEELSVLATLGSMAAEVGGPFLASASYEILGCTSLTEVSRLQAWRPLDAEKEERWQTLRMSSEASWIGLVLPRILLRLPYGPNRDEIDSFEFEEIPVSPGDHEHFLWGSSAYACAMLLAIAFMKNGDSMQPGDMLDLEDLPAFVFEVDQEQKLIPCAETWLSEATGDAILNRGIMPFLSYKNRNSARLLQFRSIASPPKTLNGFWS